ncbi:hypothetical protein GCM10007416_35030 [Kroppenstedtia guangzhouensis]|uniref:SR1 protein n=1 Tax=Kroppenstedtia guangzhouensis TaxID=1274356 RepID=A0ABQ1H6D3_9BACL|nr:hypothetical protein GCM10007416_35030 [Kroppenstedtia guangzhouensis]
MLVVTVRCKKCKNTRDVHYVGAFPVDEYDCECKGDVEEISSRSV